ncbi:S26 family signal peptidase [Natrinema sp. CBA1119]|uniref:S26 family signal peptidase n=1 Tax=Natrinema sp. CBA1119 TaxID=1608465 RepID=UPI000BF5005B|nr:S26 family signal peptidase [Natrinema sp. CBA1119]PGF15968.1 S26 family signal peptidase [Natrinema sp. CBA1119]
MDGPDADDRNRDRPSRRDPPSGPETGPPSKPGDRERTAGSRSRAKRDDAVTIEDDGVVRWLLETEDRTGTAVRDIATIGAIIAVVGVLLFGITGAWPPMVAVESGSMEPALERGDLVFIADDGRFAGDGAVAGTGIVTAQSARETGYERLGEPGDVIIFVPNGDSTQTPTIHRAQFRVERGERWVETKADPAYMNGATCTDLASCPAPHDGFVTKGDANPAYDQLPRSGAETTVVSAEWVTGKAMVRVPWVGGIRLTIDSIRSIVGSGPIVVAAVGTALALVWYGAIAGERDP